MNKLLQTTATYFKLLNRPFVEIVLNLHRTYKVRFVPINIIIFFEKLVSGIAIQKKNIRKKVHFDYIVYK